jgi:hypothetical protein
VEALRQRRCIWHAGLRPGSQREDRNNGNPL